MEIEFEPHNQTNRRKNPRVRLGESVLFEDLAEHESGTTVGFDISEGGLRVRFNDYVPVGTELSLRITLPSQKVVDCAGVVVWAAKEPFNDSYQAGVRFEQSENIIDSKEKIYHYIEAFQS